MDFRILGPVEARTADRVLGIGHARQRAVLALLLLDVGHVVSFDSLIDRLWGQEPPASARDALYVYVRRLRTALAAADHHDRAAITRQAGGYALEATREQVDLFRFRRLVADAKAPDGDDEQVGRQLSEALRLWRGQPLAGLDSPWLNAMRHTLELERHAAVLDLNDVRLRLGQHAALVSELTALATAEPADERLTGQLMLALYRCGRQAEALRRFDQARKYLAAEVGADPGPELRALHEHILRADPALSLDATSLAATPPAATSPSVGDGQRAAPVPRELPADVAGFTGRATELAALDELLLATREGEQATAAVISAVSGTAGVGKTALAVHWAHHAAARFPDGQLHVNLRGYDPDQPVTAADALAGFLRSLGVPGPDIPAEESERVARYRSLLAGQRMLIVLDNAATVEQVRPLLPGHPECRVLVTSRDSLAGLVARDGARRLDLDLLPLADAVALLHELIGAPAAADPDAVTQLAEQCARLPLALRVAAELAAARPATPLADLVAELADEQRRLDLLYADGDPRTAVRRVFAWSCEHLDEQAGRAFRLAGLHPGPDFDSYALAALTGSTLDEARRALDTLTRAHLIQPAAAGRYTMHDLLRAYARDLAAGTDGAEESRAALTRLFDYYLATAAAAMDTLYPAERHRRPRITPNAKPALPVADASGAGAWLEAERANIVAMAAYAADNGWPSHAVQTSATLFRLLQGSGRTSDEASIHGAARRAAAQLGDLAAEAAALNGLGSACRRQGRYQQAGAHHRQALAISRKAGNRKGQAGSLHNLGLVEEAQGDYRQAARHLSRALALFREIGERSGEAATLNHLGVVATDLGQYQEAGSYHQLALGLCRELGNRLGEAMALCSLGVTQERLGRYQQAVENGRLALALYRELGYQRGAAAVLNNLGVADRRLGHYDQAIAWHRQALDILLENGDLADAADVRNELGKALLAIGQTAEAEREHTEALRLAGQVGHKLQRARAYEGLGQCDEARGNVRLARERWERALAIYAELGGPEADDARARLAALEDRDS